MEVTSDSTILDVPSRQVLLLLSRGQSLSIQEICRALNRPIESVRDSLKRIEQYQFIANNNGRFELTKVGFTFLTKKGFRSTIPSAKSSTSPQEEASIPTFGTWRDFGLWLIFPLLIIGIILTPLAFFVNLIEGQFLRVVVVILSTGSLFFLLYLYVKKSYYSVTDYERMVLFRLGNCIGSRGPGPVFILPFVDKKRLVDIRVRNEDIPHESCITQDNIHVDINFIFYWQIQYPTLSLTRIVDPVGSIRSLASAILRGVIAQFQFSELLDQRDTINTLMEEKINEICIEWGITVTTVELRETKAPKEIIEAMQKHRASEWERQATITAAEAQAEALKLLYSVANSIDEKTLNLKYIEMLNNLGKGESTKYFFPLEFTNLVRPLMKAMESSESEYPTNITNTADYSENKG